jgi:type I restriction enzyme S subunit
LVLFLRSRATGGYWDYARQGTTFNEVAISAVRVLPILVPTKTEQQEILTATQRSCAPVDTAITRLEREIQLLREYRTRLVADVVTGKLDVRPAARHLPAEPGAFQDSADAEETEAEGAIEPAGMEVD